jgi:transketolase N-terminal domain/subunit
MSKTIKFDGIGNLFWCSYCHEHGSGDPKEDSWNYVILSKGHVPVAILCRDCKEKLMKSGKFQEEEGILILD